MAGLRGRTWLRHPWAVAGPGCGARGRWQRLAAAPVGGGRAWLRHPWTVAAPGCGARGRWRGLAAAPVGGGEAWPGFEIDHSEPSGSRVAISRAGRRPRRSPAPQQDQTAPGTPAEPQTQT